MDFQVYQTRQKDIIFQNGMYRQVFFEMFQLRHENPECQWCFQAFDVFRNLVSHFVQVFFQVRVVLKKLFQSKVPETLPVYRCTCFLELQQ
ncbi:hypothetical protein D3C86_1308340 [compost metagenome]